MAAMTAADKRVVKVHGRNDEERTLPGRFNGASLYMTPGTFVDGSVGQGTV